jgi:hypothetical protein
MAKTKVTGGYIADSAITSDHLHTTLDLSTKTLTIGATTVSGHLIPDTNITYDLGSSTNRFRDIYLDGTTINLGGTELKKNDAGDIEFKSGSNFKKLVISELEFDDGTNRKKFKIDSGRIKSFDSSGVSDTADKISLSSNTTDDLGEGSTNLYFTTARARGAISVSGNALSYNSSTGVLTANYEESPSFTGNVTVSGTVDGRDIAADGTKLDGIESGATADQTQAEINALGITATGLSGTPNVSIGNITTTGYLRGPSTFTIDPATHGDDTGTLVIAGNLQVDGTTTTINSTTLTVDDKLITLASGSANAAAANGAGIEVEISGATNPSILYNGTNDEWDFNKDINVLSGGQILNLASRTMTTSSDFTIDSVGDITLDAGGSDIKFRGSGLLFGQISKTGNADFILRSYLSDRDTIFQGNDGGSVITALTLDMSEAGEATFNAGATFGGDITVTGTVDGVDIAARDAVLTSTTTTAGAALPKAGGTMTGTLAMGANAITSTGTISSGAITSTGNIVTSGGNINVETGNGAKYLIVRSTSSRYSQIFGYGIRTSPGTGIYNIWPAANDSSTFDFGNFSSTLNWKHVRFHSTNGLSMGSTQFIDSARNLTNIGTISSGAITSTGIVTATGGNSTNWNTAYGWGNHASQSYITNSTASLDANKITSGVLNAARIPSPVNGDWWNGGVVKVGTDGVMEVGKYLDFHTADSGGNTDYDLRVTASPGALSVAGTISSGDITATGLSLSGTPDSILNLTSTDDGAIYMAFNRNSDRHAYVGFGSSNDTFNIMNEETGGQIALGTAGTNALTINSSQNVTFAGTISSGAITSTGAVEATGLDINGNGTFSGSLNFDGGVNNSGYIKFEGSNVIGKSNNWLYIDANNSFGSGIYINNDIRVDGGKIGSYNEDLQLRTGTTTVLTLSNADQSATFVGTLEATSFSDGTISGITFIDEDSFSTNSATRVPTQQSIKAYVDAQVAGVVDTAPSALNTLNELAAALGDDANFSTTTSTALGNRLRVDTASQGLTGTQQANAITNLGITATKAELNYVDGVTSNIQTQLDGKQATGNYLTTSTSFGGDVSGTYNNIAVANNSHQHSQLYENGTIDFGASYVQWTDQSSGGTGLDGAAPRNPAAGWYHNLIFNHANGTGYYSQIATGLNSSDIYFTRVQGGTAQDWQRIFADDYHPNADKWTTARTITLGGDLTGNVSIDGSANVTLTAAVVNDSHTHDGRYFTETETNNLLANKTELNHIRSLGTQAFTGTATTAGYISEMESDGAFDSYSSVFKTSWSYAGNFNISDAGTYGPTETAGMSHLTWTDNSSDTARGNITVLAIAPNTGGSAGRTFIYNDQGSSYGPGWREIWTSRRMGAGTGLDADKLDAQEGSYYLNYNNFTNTPTIPTNNNQLTNGAGYTTNPGFSRYNASTSYSTYSNRQIFYSNTNMATASSYQASLEVFASGSGNDAFMSFHVGSDFACYLGLDGGTNKLSVGGWSMGANSYEIYHAGNKPSLATLGFTGASNANYITNNNQLTNGAGYITSADGGNAATLAGYGWGTYNKNVAADNFQVEAGDGQGLRFWNGDSSYSVYMSQDGASGAGNIPGLTAADYNMYFRMSGGTNRGFAFQSSTGTPHSGIDAGGNASFNTVIGTSNLSSVSSPRYDNSFYVLQSQHWYGQSASQLMYLGESTNPFRLRGNLHVGSNISAPSDYKMSVAGNMTMNDTHLHYCDQIHGNDVRFNNYYDKGYTFLFKANTGSGVGRVISLANTTGDPSTATTAATGISWGQRSDSNPYYLIHTKLENVGGNYTKLCLDWHTGVRIGAASSYGGTRFYNNSSFTGSEIFSIGNGDNHLRIASSGKLYFGGNTTYGIGAGGHNFNSGYFDTVESGLSTDTLELVYYSGVGVNVGQTGSKPLGCSEIRFNANTTNRKISSSTGFYSSNAGVRIHGNWNEFEVMGRVLDVSGSNCHFMDGYGSTNHASHYLQIGTASGGNGGLSYVRIGTTLNVDGDVVAYYSDARLKQNVETIPNALEILKGIRGVTFEWNKKAESVWKKKEGDKDFGMIAQEVDAVFPMGTVVQGNADKNKEMGYADPDSPNYDPLHDGERDEPEYKTIKYDKMVTLAIQAIKEQQETIEKLTRRVDELENKGD